MISLLYLSTLLLSLLTANPEATRLSTVQPTITVIAGTQNYTAVLVEGALPESCSLLKLEGPGQIEYDKSVRRWLWSWQPSMADTGKSFTVTVADLKSKARTSFTIQTKAFIGDRNLQQLGKKIFYTGIPTNVNAKQAGLDGAYSITCYFDDSVAARSSEPTISVKPHLLNDVGRNLRLTIEYTAPLTGRTVLLKEYSTKLRYAQMRTPSWIDMHSDEPLFFRAALGLPPNFYTTMPGKVLIASSNGYFKDTAVMLMGSYSAGDDPFGMFEQTATKWQQSSQLCFDFGLLPTEKLRSITDTRGELIDVTLTEPITKQTTLLQIRVYPRRVKAEQ
jgi:hypothetical protein